MRTRELRATAIGVLAIGLWALLAPLTALVGALPPFELLCLSFGVAFLCGIAVLAWRGPAALAELYQPPAPWLTAFAALFFYHALYFFALQAAPPAEANLINYLWPLLIVLMSAWAGGERGGAQTRHLVGALFGLAGTAIILIPRDHGTADRAAALGYAAAFACALIWSGYSVRNRRFASTPSGMLVGVCGAVSVAGGLCHLLTEHTVRPDPAQTVIVVAIGAGPTGLAFLAWDHATKHGRLPLLGALSYLIPLASTILLALEGKIGATFLLLLAAILVMLGAVIASSGKRSGDPVTAPDWNGDDGSRRSAPPTQP